MLAVLFIVLFLVYKIHWSAFFVLIFFRFSLTSEILFFKNFTFHWKFFYKFLLKYYYLINIFSVWKMPFKWYPLFNRRSYYHYYRNNREFWLTDHFKK